MYIVVRESEVLIRYASGGFYWGGGVSFWGHAFDTQAEAERAAKTYGGTVEKRRSGS